MKRYIFSVSSGEPQLLTDDQHKALLAGYGSEDPGLKFLRVIHYRLDPDDLAEIHLIDMHRYKDPNSAAARKFFSHTTAMAAGIAELFKNPRFRVLYVVIEVGDDYYDLSVLQDMHPVAINGSKVLVPALLEQKIGMAVKSGIAGIASQLRVDLAKARATATPAPSGMDP